MVPVIFLTVDGTRSTHTTVAAETVTTATTAATPSVQVLRARTGQSSRPGVRAICSSSCTDIGSAGESAAELTEMRVPVGRVTTTEWVVSLI